MKSGLNAALLINVPFSLKYEAEVKPIGETSLLIAEAGKVLQFTA